MNFGILASSVSGILPAALRRSAVRGKPLPCASERAVLVAVLVICAAPLLAITRPATGTTRPATAMTRPATAVISGGRDLGVYLKADGAFDLEKTRRDHVEGRLDPHGFAARLGHGALQFLPQPAQGDERWSDAFGLAGLDWFPWCTTHYGGHLIVAGGFLAGGGAPLARIGQWDGTSWSPLHDGVTAYCGGPRDMVVWNGDLIAAGDYDEIDHQPISYLARWDGTNWSSMGVVLSGEEILPEALAVWNGDLYIGGRFTYANGVEVNNIVRWDGTACHPLAGGTDGTVWDLLVYNGALLASGSFTQAGDTGASAVATWDGTAWHPLGDGLPVVGCEFGAVRVAVYNGEVIAGGEFIDDWSGIHNIARFDGVSWQPLGTGASGTVFGLQVYQGSLYAAGDFDYAGGAPVTGFARWNDEEGWTCPGRLTGWMAGQSGDCYMLGLDGDRLLVGGCFTHTPDCAAYCLAGFDGSHWYRVGEGDGFSYDNRPNALCAWEDGVVAGGNFDLAGTTAANRVAYWDGLTWSPLGDGFDGPAYGLATHNGSLIAGGSFTHAGGAPASRVARWDGSAWSPIGDGFNDDVLAVVSHNGSLYAAGSFTNSGGVSTPHVARWDGAAWVALGTGTNAKVRALAGYAGDLIATGDFTTAGGVTVNGIAAWDGSAWRSLGTGLNSPGYTLAVYGPDLIVGGTFSSAGGQQTNRLARWDGSAWHPLGRLHTSDTVNALAVCGGRLFLAGEFEAVGGMPARNVAAFNGTNWAPLGSGTNFLAEAATAVSEGVYFAGGFEITAGKVSSSFAYWQETPSSGTPAPPWRPGDDALHISWIRPNPFAGMCRVGFVMPQAGPTEIAVLDASGRQVAVLSAGWRPAGTQEATWDGRNQSGRPAAPGVYWIRLAQGTRHAAARLVLTGGIR